MVGNGIRAQEIPTLFTYQTLQDVYRSFCVEIPSEQACVGGAHMQMVVTISIIWLQGHHKAETPKCRTKSLITNWDRRGANKFGRMTTWCTALCNVPHGWPLQRYNPFFNHKDYAKGIFNPAEEWIGGACGGLFSHSGAPLQNGKWWYIARICTEIWMRTDPRGSTWWGWRRTLCGTCDGT